MHGEIIIKITNFDDEDSQIQEIINWLQHMVKHKKDMKIVNRKKTLPEISKEFDNFLESNKPAEDKPTEDSCFKTNKDNSITCGCGSSFDSKNLIRHKKTLKHINFLENKN